MLPLIKADLGLKDEEIPMINPIDDIANFPSNNTLGVLETQNKWITLAIHLIISILNQG